MSSYTYI
ncbi:putative aryl-alcohol dehydrogenase YPL088W [Kluyveromyces marxianus]|nr:putative aryl-alcohol dehydrogenase YPL088W [Kluyveromyces marxianus]